MHLNGDSRQGCAATREWKIRVIRRTTMTHAKRFLLAIVLLAWPGNIDAWEIDENGRVSLNVSFLSGDGPMPTAAEQLFYCSVFQNASNILWQATDGQHYIGEVGFAWN